MSLIQSAWLNGHDPYAYLKDVLTRLPMQRASEITELLPHKWAPVQPPKVCWAGADSAGTGVAGAAGRLIANVTRRT